VTHDTYIDGILIERRDDVARTVTTYNATGTLTGTRPYTAAENAAADAAAAVEADRLARAADRKAVRALVDGINASIDERDTDNALIGAEQGVKALAKYVRDQ
jgi:hypothetical protein